jgi:hypothetical protein
MEKRGRGRPLKLPRVPLSELPRMALELNREQLAEQSGVSKHVAETMRTVTRYTVEDFQEKQRDQLQGILVKLGQRIEDEIERLSPAQKAITYGILADKLANQPRALTQSLHIHIKGGDAGSALRALLGPQGDSIFGRPPPPTNNASAPVDVTAIPVTDATPPHASDSKSPASNA